MGVLRLRPVDIERLRSPISPLTTRNLVQEPPITHTAIPGNKALVRLADPHLVLAIKRLIHPLNLSSFENWSGCVSPFPLDYLEQATEGIEATLAPYSLLAMCLRPFIRRIIHLGLGVAKQQKSLREQVYCRTSAKGGGQHDISLLTPTHILTGLRSHGRETVQGETSVDEAILLCLSNLGMIFSSCQQGNEVVEKAIEVKTEKP